MTTSTNWLTRRPAPVLALAVSIAIAILLWAGGAAHADSHDQDKRARKGNGEPLRVLTSINVLSQPLAEVFATEINTGAMRIEPLMDIGSDPHLYVPTRLDLAKILDADLVLFIGLGLEAQFDDVLGRTGPSTVVKFVGEDVPTDRLLSGYCPTQGGDCVADPHIWMDPSVFEHALISAVVAIRSAQDLQLRMDDAAVEIRALTASLDQALRDMLADASIAWPMITAHDAFGYFAEAYGVETLGLAGISTDVEPSLRRVQALSDLIVDQAVPAVFLESSVPPRGVQSLIETAQSRGQDVKVLGPLYTDSLGPTGSGADTWASMLLANSAQIACALGRTPPTKFCEELSRD